MKNKLGKTILLSTVLLGLASCGGTSTNVASPTPRPTTQGGTTPGGTSVASTPDEPVDPFADYDKVLNISTTDFADATNISTTTTLDTGFEATYPVAGDASHALTVSTTDVTLDGITFTKMLKSNGNSNLSSPYRVIKFTTTAKAKIDIWAKYGSSEVTDTRSINLYNISKKWDEGSASVATADPTKYTIEAHFASDYYITFTGNISLYAIGIKTGTGEDSDWVPAQADPADNNILNGGEIVARRYTSNLTMGIYTINAGSGTDEHVDVEGNTKKYKWDGDTSDTSYTRRIKLGGKGSKTYRSITINAPSAGKLTILALSSSSGTARNAQLIKNSDDSLVGDVKTIAGKGVTPGTSEENSNYLVAVIYNIEAEGAYTFFDYQESGGINVYSMVFAPTVAPTAL